MDPFISVFGRENHLIFLDCRSHEAQEIPFAEPSISILIFNTNVRHELSRSEYPLRRAQCEAAARELGVASLRDVTPERLQERHAGLQPVTLRRARHVATEMVRVRQMVAALRDGRWSDAGDRPAAGAEILRQ
jgi:galactokinase